MISLKAIIKIQPEETMNSKEESNVCFPFFLHSKTPRVLIVFINDINSFEKTLLSQEW